ncbi:MAG TPA: hypothetical protein VLG25_01030 [Patescibacteria group bacterium]|nr:hypothetical protein [Patescibacteria group bacterium]
MLDKVLIHEQLKTRLRGFITSDTHALLISGPKGAGKGFLMQVLAAEILGTDLAKLSNNRGFVHIKPQANSIGIDDIRELKRSSRLKTTGKAKIRRVILVENAEQMTDEAQNAFLKLLEEPPEDTVILLTENGESQLRDTVYSRLQRVKHLPLSKKTTTDYFLQKKLGAHEIERVYHLTGGKIGLMYSLLAEDTDNVLVDQVRLAKELLAAASYERMLRIDEIARNKENLVMLLFALRQVCLAALNSAATTSNEKQMKLWHKRAKLIFKTEQAANLNPNSKLLLTNLFLGL